MAVWSDFVTFIDVYAESFVYIMESWVTITVRCSCEGVYNVESWYFNATTSSTTSKVEVRGV